MRISELDDIEKEVLLGKVVERADHEIINHHGTTFWVTEEDLDYVLGAYNDLLLHPRWQWLQRTGRTK